jgi:hypothetical protein
MYTRQTPDSYPSNGLIRQSHNPLPVGVWDEEPRRLCDEGDVGVKGHVGERGQGHDIRPQNSAPISLSVRHVDCRSDDVF